MITRSRIIAFIAVVGALAVLAAIATFGSYRVSLSIEQVDTAVMAESLHDIPSTTTPVPPTATALPTATIVEPTATTPPTATPVQPTATLVVPTATTAIPTATADSPSATPAPPTATSELPPTPPVRSTFDEPTPIVIAPGATAVPTAVPGLPNVVIEKRASVAAAQTGQNVVFILTARNTGTEAARDVVVMDVVPDAFTIVDLQSTRGDIVADGQTVTAYPAVLAPGQQVVITITTTVRSDAEVAVQRNTAFITTSTPGDAPEDNTSSVSVQIVPLPTNVPATTKTLASSPVQMPNTADPDVSTALMVLGPWMMLAMCILMIGACVRFGMLRTRFVTVSLAARSAHVQEKPLQVQEIELDAVALVAAWRSGASIATLSRQVCNQNPHADRFMVGLAVQQIIDETLSQ